MSGRALILTVSFADLVFLHHVQSTKDLVRKASLNCSLNIPSCFQRLLLWPLDIHVVVV